MFGTGFRQAGESFVVWYEVDSEVAAMKPRVDVLHDGKEVECVVIVFVRYFRHGKGF